MWEAAGWGEAAFSRLPVREATAPLFFFFFFKFEDKTIIFTMGWAISYAMCQSRISYDIDPRVHQTFSIKNGWQQGDQFG